MATNKRAFDLEVDVFPKHALAKPREGHEGNLVERKAQRPGGMQERGTFWELKVDPAW